MTPPRRKLLSRFGGHGRSVRVYVEPQRDAVVVHWGGRGKRQKRQFPNTAAGKTQALAFAQELVGRGDPATRTVRSVDLLWEAYRDAPDWDRLAKKTQINYQQCWDRFAQRFSGARPESVDFTALDQFRNHMLRLNLAPSVQRHSIALVKLVFRWANGHRLITENHLEGYRFRSARGGGESPAEYSGEEWEQLLAVLDPWNGHHWRAYVALSIIGAQGVRSISALHLAWEDVDEVKQIITWRAAYDKNRRTWYAPLREQTRQALAVARWWQEVGTRRGPARPSRWVLPANHPRNQRETYTHSALWYMLRQAEKRANIFHERGRALHGLRRMLAGDVYDETQSVLAAMEAIGDQTITIMERYLKNRGRRVADAVLQLDRKRPTTPLLAPPRGRLPSTPDRKRLEKPAE